MPEPTSGEYAVSRSKGRQSGESKLSSRLRAKRKAMGKAHSSDESEPEDPIEEGATVVHQLFNRKVVLCPDNTVLKVGKRIALGEGAALKIAIEADLPVPAVHEVVEKPNGERQIRMDLVKGRRLDEVWPEMTSEQKKDVGAQLRTILNKMRSIAPPPDYIGACDGMEIRDTRSLFTYHAPACQSEAAFNNFLCSALLPESPPLIRQAFLRRLRTDHKVVFTHCDLTPWNILIHDGKITGLIDWEDGGWYPEYWEYVKFFQRLSDKDWKDHAEYIFPELYHDELVDYIALSAWQRS